MRRAALLACVACFAGCSFIPPYERPPTQTPASWRTTTDEAASLADLSWWTLYQDPELQQLIRIALAENNDLAIAVQRVEEARARYGMDRAKLFPQIGGQAVNINSTSIGSYGFLVGLSWEIDLFGRLRALTEAAQHEYLASAQTQRAVYVSLIAEVASNYLMLRDQDQRLAIARATLATRVESMRLVRRRFEIGIISELDVKESEILVFNANEQIAGLERDVAQTENRISVLIGRPPAAIPRGQTLANQMFPPQVPAGLPSALLERRPDIIAAEEQLRGSNARVGAAKSEYFPNISLTATYGASTTELLNFTQEGSLRDQWMINAGLTQPLLTFGRLSGSLDFSNARDRQSAEKYKQTVLTAFKEVNDALVAHLKYGEQKKAQEDSVAAERVRLRLTRARYDIGYSNFLQVLDADRSLLEAEYKLSDLQRRHLDSVVQLYKALGGGWSPPNSPVEPLPSIPLN